MDALDLAPPQDRAAELGGEVPRTDDQDASWRLMRDRRHVRRCQS
jgi:hypothetical protein